MINKKALSLVSHHQSSCSKPQVVSTGVESKIRPHTYGSELEKFGVKGVQSPLIKIDEVPNNIPDVFYNDQIVSFGSYICKFIPFKRIKYDTLME